MFKIVNSLLMIIMFLSSCATKKQMATSTTKTDIIIDSATQNRDIAEDLQIEWFIDSESASGITDSSDIPKWLKPILPSTDKPPRKGKLRISLSKHFSSSSYNQTKVEKSAKIKKKEKEKTTEKAKGNVKSKNLKWVVILIIVIIIGFIVKYLLEHKNSIEKTWCKMKKSLSLQHPNEHRGNAEERPSERH